jgi:Leucine-rich repeat (LRR) protein
MQQFILVSFIILLSACSSRPYSVTLNDNVIYSPNNVIDDGIMTDANLQGCLNQVYISTENDDPEQVTLLACPNAGVQSIIGIEALVNLEQLELSGNNISDINSLINLKKLRVLGISNNQVRNINVLFSLPILRFISLQGNNAISCRQLNRLENEVGNTLNRPLNCS